MSTGTFGNGAALGMGGTTISELTSIGLPGFSSDDIDVTTHNDTDKIRQYVKGLTDPGEISFEGNMNYTDYSNAFIQAVTTSMFTATITIPTTPSVTVLQFQAYVKGLEGTAPHDDKVEMSGTLKVSGMPILTKV